MPLFEYKCGKCGARATHLVRRSEEEPRRCESCRSAKLARVISRFSVGGSGAAKPEALRSSARDFVERPEQFGEAMRAFGERTGMEMPAERVDEAMHRLSEAKNKT